VETRWVLTALLAVAVAAGAWVLVKLSRCPAAQDLYALGRCTDEVLS
jgi:hypothetical protein